MSVEQLRRVVEASPCAELPARVAHPLLPLPRPPSARRRGSRRGCPAKPLVSYRSNRQLSGWNPPPLVLRAVGAHWESRVKSGERKQSTLAHCCLAKPERSHAKAAFGCLTIP